jgi:hypothetical protein
VKTAGTDAWLGRSGPLQERAPLLERR